MLYRYEILAEDGVYEGWARSEEEMGQKFDEQFPKRQREIFLFGLLPKGLTLDQFIVAKGLKPDGVSDDTWYRAIAALNNLLVEATRSVIKRF